MINPPNSEIQNNTNSIQKKPNITQFPEAIQNILTLICNEITVSIKKKIPLMKKTSRTGVLVVAKRQLKDIIKQGHSQEKLYEFITLFVDRQIKRYQPLGLLKTTYNRSKKIKKKIQEAKERGEKLNLSDEEKRDLLLETIDKEVEAKQTDIININKIALNKNKSIEIKRKFDEKTDEFRKNICENPILTDHDDSRKCKLMVELIDSGFQSFVKSLEAEMDYNEIESEIQSGDWKEKVDKVESILGIPTKNKRDRICQITENSTWFYSLFQRFKVDFQIFIKTMSNLTK